jgi:hypothetical protein
VALGIAGRFRHDHLAGDVLSLLGLVLLARGDLAGGRRAVLDAAWAIRRNGSRMGIVQALEGLAAMALADSRPATATRALAAVDGARQNAPMVLWPVIASLAADLADRSRTELGNEHFEAAWDEGRNWSLVQALDRTLEQLGDTDTPADIGPHRVDDDVNRARAGGTGPPGARRAGS